MKLYLFKMGIIHPYGVPIPSYLIQTDNGLNILVDTGLPYSYITNPQQPPGIQFKMEEEDYIVNRLNEIGLKPENIHYLICTHLDIDHAGNNELFKSAEIIIQRVNYELDKVNIPRLALSKEHWDGTGFSYRMIDGDTNIMAGLDLIETRGHVPGHQSVLIDLPKTGKVLLAIDAIPATYLTDPETRLILPTDMDEPGVRIGTKKIMDLVKVENVQLLIHGHDMDQWSSLKHAPEYYE